MKPVVIVACLALPMIALTLSYPNLPRLSPRSDRDHVRFNSNRRFSADKEEARSPSPLPGPKAEGKKPLLNRPPSPTKANKPLVESRVTILGSMQMGGSFTRQRYRFENVHLSSSDTLSVFLPEGVELPKVETSLDVVHGHAKGGHLPTELFYMSHNPKRVVSLGVHYRRATAAAQPRCRRWEERPVLLLQVPHNTNIWHSWNDGLVGAYQTLREDGLLPLAEIDGEGNMKEYTADLDTKGCPPEIELGSGLGPEWMPVECSRPRTGFVTARKCSPAKDAWCAAGVVAVNRSQGPIILRADGTYPFIPKWEAMLQAVSEDVREWDTEIGTCFRELYIGKSNTLNFLIALRRYEMTTNLAIVQELQKKALAGFQAVMATVFRSKSKHEPAWKGYADPGMERLRQGIGLEDVTELEALRKARRRSIRDDERATDDEKQGLRRALIRSRDELKELTKGLGQRARRRSGSGSRPVVTLMSRSALSRAVLNEADVVEFILYNYDVTVKVTTLEEPLLETTQLLAGTDVLIASHGAGLTNGLFLKPGGVAMQLFPYGWRHPGVKRTIRGYAYGEIIEARGCEYMEWVNPNPGNAYMRRCDFKKKTVESYSVHPLSEWPLPVDNHPGNHWIYMNTRVGLAEIAPHLRELMEKAGVPPSPAAADA